MLSWILLLKIGDVQFETVEGGVIDVELDDVDLAELDGLMIEVVGGHDACG